MRWIYGFLVVVMSTCSAVSGQRCPKPDEVVYPLSEVLMAQAIVLDLKAYYISDPELNNSPKFGTDAFYEFQRDTIFKALAEFPPPQQDALLLARLLRDTIGTIPLVSPFLSNDEQLIDAYIELLIRQELTELADILQQSKDAFPFWNKSVTKRYHQVYDGHGGVTDPQLLEKITELSEEWRKFEPMLMIRASFLIMRDPTLRNNYSTLKEDVSDDDRLRYLNMLISHCIGHWEVYHEVDDRLKNIDPPLGIIYELDYMLMETFNGGFHQYVYNSSGVFASRLAKRLDDLELPDHANAVRKALKVFDGDYPRDTQTRREIMSHFSSKIDQILDEATWISDDGEIIDAIIKLAKDTRYWPQ